MWTDPIVDEVRRLRDEHARSLNYDVAAIFADLRRLEASSGVPLVRRPPRPAILRETLGAGERPQSTSEPRPAEAAKH